MAVGLWDAAFNHGINDKLCNDNEDNKSIWTYFTEFVDAKQPPLMRSQHDCTDIDSAHDGHDWYGVRVATHALYIQCNLDYPDMLKLTKFKASSLSWWALGSAPSLDLFAGQGCTSLSSSFFSLCRQEQNKLAM